MPVAFGVLHSLKQIVTVSLLHGDDRCGNVDLIDVDLQSLLSVVYFISKKCWQTRLNLGQVKASWDLYSALDFFFRFI